MLPFSRARMGLSLLCLYIAGALFSSSEIRAALTPRTDILCCDTSLNANNVQLKHSIRTSLSRVPVPTDPLFPYQWSLENDGYAPPGTPPKLAGADIDAVGAWALLNGYGSPDITIAVYDQDFDPHHPDLKGKITAPLNAYTGSQILPADSQAGSHGTSCASIALASANGIGIVGVAPQAALIPIHGLSFDYRVIGRALKHAISNKADIISCSWGTVDPDQQPEEHHIAPFIEALLHGRRGKGAIIVVAVGNEGFNNINYYARIPGVIAVGASTSIDQHAPYSNRGMGISVVAPSSGEWSTIAARPWWDKGPGHPASQQHKYFGGTSSSTALVAGVCALVLSANPDLLAAEVKFILEQTADKIGSPYSYDDNGYSRLYGYGRVNAARAVAMAIAMREKKLNESPYKGPKTYAVSSSSAIDSIGQPLLREVKVIDPDTGTRYWLIFHDHEELMALRKHGFILKRIRPLRNRARIKSAKPNGGVGPTIKEILIELGKEGIREIFRRQETKSKGKL